MLSKTKIKIASLISAIAGILVYPRPSLAKLGMPAPSSTSQQSASQQRSSGVLSRTNISVNAVKGGLSGQEGQALQNYLNQQNIGGAGSISLGQLLNYVTFRLGQRNMGAPGQ